MLPPLSLSVGVPTRLAIFWRAHLTLGAKAPSPRRDGQSLLVIRCDGLGDVVLTTPLFRELKRAFPKSSCTVVVQEAFRSLLVTNPHIDEIISLPPFHARWLPERVRTLLSVFLLYWGRLRGRRFDMAISPRWDVDDRLATLLCSLTDARERIGYTEKVSPAKQRHNRGFDAAFDRCLSAGPVQHEVLRNLEIAKALGGNVIDNSLEISLTHRDREFASKLRASVPASSTLIAIGIGGGGASRRWPLENYAECVRELRKERSVQPVIVCSHDERQDACKLARLLLGDAMIVSGAPLRKVCAVLERCDLFIGNDSGSAHLAGAMNCKVIVISRHPSGGDPNHANSPLRFAPYCDQVRVLQPKVGLDGCTVACTSSEPHCITAVSVDEVVAAAREMLPRDSASSTCTETHMVPHNDDSRPGSNPAAASAHRKAAELSEVGRRNSASLP